MQPTKTITLITLLTLLVLPLISAQWGWGYGYSNPIYFLENEWVLFTVLFLIFLAVIFYTVNKTMKNQAVAMTIAVGLSLLISLAIAQRGLISGYGLGGELGSWLLLIASLIGIAFLIRFAAESFGWVGTLVTLILLWMLIRFIEPSQLLPEMLLYNYRFMNFYEEFLRSGWGLIIISGIGFIITRGTRKTIKEVNQIIENTTIPFRRLGRR